MGRLDFILLFKYTTSVATQHLTGYAFLRISGADPTSSISSDTPADNNTKHLNRAWIAGAVIGPIVGVLIALAIFIFLRRKRRREANASEPADDIGGKAQLHGDSTDVKELPDSECYGENGRPEELSDSSSPDEAAGRTEDGHYNSTYEMPANEPPATEMMGNSNA